MRGKNHIDIVGAIANRQSHFVRKSVANHFNNVCLLLRRDAAGEDYVGAVGDVTEAVKKTLVFLDVD